MDGFMDGWMYRCMDVCMYGCMYDWMDVWMDLYNILQKNTSIVYPLNSTRMNLFSTRRMISESVRIFLQK